MTGQSIHLLVGMVFRDAASTLPAAVDSVLAQDLGAHRLTVLLVDDASTDNWRDTLGDRLGSPDLHVHRVAYRSAARARNHVLDAVVRDFPDVDYVCRLDADDVLARETVLAEVGAALARTRPDALLAGNLQRLDGVLLPRPNRATADLRDPVALLERLARMAAGDPTAELPSCNTVVRRGLPLRYPLVESAEDHWFTVELLLNREAWDVLVVPDLIYATYRLRGRLTTDNRGTEAHLASRRALLEFARSQVWGRPDGTH